VQAGKTGSRFTRGIEKVNDVRRSVSPIAQRTSAFRTGLGEQVLAGAPEGAEAGPVRQALANLVQGQGGVGAPARMAGQSDSAYRMQQGVHYARTARSTLNNIKAAPEVASAVADPEGYAMKKALGGVKMGDTGEDYQTDPYGRTITGDSVNNGDVSANGIVQPRAFKGLLSENTVLRGGAKMQNFGVGVAANNSLGGPNAFWKGPGREAFGGVPKGYDWRNIQQRPVGMVARSDAFMQGHSLPSLEQPPSADASATADKPVSPPTLPSQAVAAPTPAKMVTSAMYSGGTQSNTVGARIMPSAGGNSRGGKSDHSTFYGSGTTYGEDVDFTMTGTPGWNGKDAGTMTFTKPLVQPAKPAEPLMEEPAAEAVQQKPKFTNTHGRGPGR
jgi:hypothetical protein